MSRLTLADIADLRAYERERDGFRAEIIALKKRRRVGVGPVVTFLFENRDTVRFQIQEMARAERMLTDEAIENELAAYNPLIPDPGSLSATMFIELTSPAEVRAWLPKLAGVERSVKLRIGAATVAAELEAGHASRLTRDDVTASVHYVRFVLSEAEVGAFAERPVSVAVEHPAYSYATQLRPETHRELLGDLAGRRAGS